MSGGAKYSQKHQAAILHLLSEATLEGAAQKAGIGHATLARWMNDPNFQAKYQDARRRSFEAGLARLQNLCGRAVDSLKKNLTCGRPSVETRCAEIILSHARESGALLDLTERLAKVEHDMNEKGAA